MCALRLNPWDALDEDLPEEELPDYWDSNAPAYDSGSYDEPLMVYHLRQYDRRIQILVAYGSLKSSYRVTTNGFRLFSKKPEMEILYTSRDMRQRTIAQLGFDNDGDLPWCPRAHFAHTEKDGTTNMHTMEAKDFTNWTLVLGGRKYEWTLCTSPCSLVFQEQGSSIPTARFMYKSGTSAARGAEIGELTVFRDGLTMDEEYGVDQIVCSLMVTITHLKKLGRHYSNAESEQVRHASVSRESYPMHSVSSAGFSIT